MRRLSIALVALTLALVAHRWPPSAAEERTFRVDKYCPSAWDETFRNSTRLFMPTALKTQWLRVKAQALAESSCRPDVCSSAGACGVLQLLALDVGGSGAGLRPERVSVRAQAQHRAGRSIHGMAVRPVRAAGEGSGRDSSTVRRVLQLWYWEHSQGTGALRRCPIVVGHHPLHAAGDIAAELRGGDRLRQER